MWRLKMAFEYVNQLQVYSNNVKQVEEFVEKVNFQEPGDNLEIAKILSCPEELIEINSSGEFLSTKSGAYLIFKYGNYDLIHSIIHNRSVGYNFKEILSKIPEIRNVYTFWTRNLPANLWLDGIARQYPDIDFVLHIKLDMCDEYYSEPGECTRHYYRAHGDLRSGYENYALPSPDYLFSRRRYDDDKEICFSNCLEVYSNNVKQFDKFIEIAKFMGPNMDQYTDQILPRPEELLIIDSCMDIFSTKSAAYLISKYGSYDLIHSIIHKRSIGRDVKTVFSEIPEIRNIYEFGTKDSLTRDLLSHCASSFPDLKFRLDYYGHKNGVNNIFRAHGDICSLETDERIGSDREYYVQRDIGGGGEEKL
jgi:hypothetical protein